MRGCSGNNRIIQTIVMVVHVLKSLLSLVIVAHHLKDSLAQSDLTCQQVQIRLAWKFLAMR